MKVFYVFLEFLERKPLKGILGFKGNFCALKSLKNTSEGQRSSMFLSLYKVFYVLMTFRSSYIFLENLCFKEFFASKRTSIF